MRRRAEVASGCTVTLRMTADELAALKRAAAQERVTVSAFVRDAAVLAADEALEDVRACVA